MPETQHTEKSRDDLIRVGVAASMLGVSADTFKRYEEAGHISSLRTPTGHRRYRRSDVERLRDERPKTEASA